MNKGRVSDMILEQILMGADVQDDSRGGAVISCGGIYIPHSGGRERVIYHIINTSSLDEPVKVVTGNRPRNVLHEIIQKESMN